MDFFTCEMASLIFVIKPGVCLSLSVTPFGVRALRDPESWGSQLLLCCQTHSQPAKEGRLLLLSPLSPAITKIWKRKSASTSAQILLFLLRVGKASLCTVRVASNELKTSGFGPRGTTVVPGTEKCFKHDTLPNQLAVQEFLLYHPIQEGHRFCVPCIHP